MVMKKLKIDKDKCIGCVSCELNCSEVFEIGIGNGKAEVKPEADLEKHKECIEGMIQECPVKAIYYEE